MGKGVKYSVRVPWRPSSLSPFLIFFQGSLLLPFPYFRSHQFFLSKKMGQRRRRRRKRGQFVFDFSERLRSKTVRGTKETKKASLKKDDEKHCCGSTCIHIATLAEIGMRGERRSDWPLGLPSNGRASKQKAFSSSASDVILARAASSPSPSSYYAFSLSPPPGHSSTVAWQGQTWACSAKPPYISMPSIPFLSRSRKVVT